MLDRINKLKDELKYIDTHRPKLKQARLDLKQLDNEQLQKARILEKENQDVEDLEKVGLRSIISTLTKTKESKLEKEKYEARQASLEYQRVINEYQYKKEYIAKVEEKIKKEIQILTELSQLLSSLHPGNVEILKYQKVLEETKTKINEIEEAIHKGNQVIVLLDDFESLLDEAKFWSHADAVDIPFATVPKYNNWEKAHTQIDSVNKAIQDFEEELKDTIILKIEIPELPNYYIDIIWDSTYQDIQNTKMLKECLQNLKITSKTIKDVITQLQQEKLNLKNSLKTTKTKLKEILYEL